MTAYLSFSSPINADSMNLLLDNVVGQINEGESEVHLWISSGGGFVDPCMNAYHTLKALPVKLVTHNVGAIQSIACILYLAGSVRLAGPHTTFLFHRTTWTFGERSSDADAARLREFAQACDLTDRRLYRLLNAETGMSVHKARALIQRGMSLDPESAKERGIVHEIRPASVPLGATFAQVR